MGVNMPAKTVVFDSVEKFDGNKFRNLLPTEYIQMAGRAGRRGHDTTGTVIIMCKKKVPFEKDLKDMILGAPQTLESKFKVTYSMVLHLKRLSEAISVGEMMRRSFREVRTLSSQHKNRSELEKIEEELNKLPPLAAHQGQLELFYEVASSYLTSWKSLRPLMLETKKAVKALVEGRILIISYKHHYKKLGIFLGLQKKSKELLYKVFVLSNTEEETTAAASCKSDTWYSMISLMEKKIYMPKENSIEKILEVPASSIVEVTNSIINIKATNILSDWDRRQIPRFQ